VKKILLSFILSTFIFSLHFKAEAGVLPARVQSLLSLSDKYLHDGANCFASVAYVSGLIDDASYLNSMFYESMTSTPYCRQISKQEQLQKGDFIVIGGPGQQVEGKWIHALLVMAPGKGFAKMGYKKEDKTVVTDLQKNIKSFLVQDPSLSSAMYRCDFQKLRSAIEASDLASVWQDLLVIRQQLFSELVQKDLRNHAMIVASLDRIEQKIAQSKSRRLIVDIMKSLVTSTREQLQLTDVFTVEF